MDPVPALGEHTDALLAELGYGADDRAVLRAAQAI
jgi:crotonobetainyl-CoA:carnitine CoA-transferase CaiB-like acyl-CoA transferase